MQLNLYEQIYDIENLYRASEKFQLLLLETGLCIMLLSMSLKLFLKKATLWIAKAEQSQELDTKITYYRNALAPLSFIEDEAFVVQEQNRINQIISELYQTANELRSQEYQDKVQTQQKVKEPSPIGYLIITIIVLLFIWWSFRKS